MKARYSWMNEGENRGQDGDASENGNMNSENDMEVYNNHEKSLDYANLRVTDIPTVQRFLPP